MITALRHRYLFVFPLSAAGSHLPSPFSAYWHPLTTTPYTYIYLPPLLASFTFFFFVKLFVYRFALWKRFWLSYTMHNVVVIIATLCILLPLPTIFVNVHFFIFFSFVSSTPKFCKLCRHREMSVISPSVCTTPCYLLFF
jgi:hypothetical protein